MRDGVTKKDTFLEARNKNTPRLRIRYLLAHLLLAHAKIDTLNLRHSPVYCQLIPYRERRF